MSQRHILYITYYWPPCGGPSVQRSLKFVKYLSRLGYDVEVLTVDLQYASYPFIDYGFEKDIPAGLIVHRTKARNPLKLYQRIFPKRKQTVGFANEGGKSFLSTVIRFIRGNFFIPDPRKGWNSFAWREIQRIHKLKPFDCIITSTPPHSTNLLGIKIKKKLNIPWIADLRDPWTDIYYYPQLLRTKLALKLDQRHERKTLEVADAVVTVSDSIRQTLLKKSHKLLPDKFHVIYNGFDPEDFKGIEAKKAAPHEFILSYVGVLAPNYGLNALIQAWTKAFATGNSNITFQLIGHASDEVINTLRTTIGESHFRGTGYLTHHEAIQHMINSDALLLMIPQTPDNKGILTGKLFEYLASGNPIIGIGPEDGEAAQIIREQGAGWMLDYNKVDALADALQSIQTLTTDKSHEIDLFSREAQAKKLGGIVEQILL